MNDFGLYYTSEFVCFKPARFYVRMYGSCVGLVFVKRLEHMYDMYIRMYVIDVQLYVSLQSYPDREVK